MNTDLDLLLPMFRPAPGTVYLDSATYGLPPTPTIDVLRRALDAWQDGTARWIEDWDRAGEDCRGLFAKLLGTRPEECALMPAVSVASGIVASGVPEGGEVLAAEEDFTSVLYPFLAAAERGALSVRTVPLSRLADAIGPTTRLVAVSHVQSSDGRVADLEAIEGALRPVGGRLYVDVSQSLGVLPGAEVGRRADYVAGAAYKWLCCPRGVAFLHVREDAWELPSPVVASWRGGDDPWGRYYGPPLALAETAARFDVSLAWHPWVGARRSLEILTSVSDDARAERALAVAARLADRLGVPRPESPILSLRLRDADGAGRALDAAGIRAALRAGGIRLAPHFYNDPDHADRAAEVLAPFVDLGAS